MVEDARVQLLRRYGDEAWSQGDVQVLFEVHAPRYRENDEELTPEQFCGHLLRWREEFPDFRAEIERVWLTDAAVTTRVIYTGTHHETHHRELFEQLGLGVPGS